MIALCSHQMLEPTHHVNSILVKRVPLHILRVAGKNLRFERPLQGALLKVFTWTNKRQRKKSFQHNERDNFLANFCRFLPLAGCISEFCSCSVVCSEAEEVAWRGWPHVQCVTSGLERFTDSHFKCVHDIPLCQQLDCTVSPSQPHNTTHRTAIGLKWSVCFPCSLVLTSDKPRHFSHIHEVWH